MGSRRNVMRSALILKGLSYIRKIQSISNLKSKTTGNLTYRHILYKQEGELKMGEGRIRGRKKN